MVRHVCDCKVTLIVRESCLVYSIFIQLNLLFIGRCLFHFTYVLHFYRREGIKGGTKGTGVVGEGGSDVVKPFVKPNSCYS